MPPTSSRTRAGSVTVAVPCYNGAGTLRLVLEAVGRQSAAPEEVLVVDDGSRDASARLARELGARVVTHRENRGLSAARNTALAAASSDLVVFVDADAVPGPDLVERLTRGYQGDGGLWGVGGQVLEGGAGGAADRWRGHFWRQTLGEQPLADAAFLVGACCSLRRREALDAGGFDEAYRTNGEDVELSVRLRRLGGRLAYDPSAQVVHLRRDTPRSLLAMVHRHSRDHVRALESHGESSREVVRNALRWGPVTLVSSLRRHRSLSLAALSPLCHAASLAGCAEGWLRGRAVQKARAAQGEGGSSRTPRS